MSTLFPPFGNDDKNNMDQTPVFFSFGSGKTLALMGSRSVPGRVLPHVGLTSHAASFLSVMASGTMLMSLIAFKGTPNGPISQQLQYCPAGAQYVTQVKAWYDKRIIIYWVNAFLGHYSQTAPPDVRPVLLMDRFRVHLMDDVVDLTNAMVAVIIYVPAGCISLVQPLNIGINKPFEDSMR
jgi:hypothetical protein